MLFNKTRLSIQLITSGILFSAIFFSCKPKSESKEEQISVGPSSGNTEGSDTSSAVHGSVSLRNISTTPTSVILTGLPEHRLVTIYKSLVNVNTQRDNMSYSYSYDYDGTESERVEHFMPGIDILYGYNLLNVAHYDLKQEKLNALFNGPALIKTLYYPSFVQDSIDKKPVNRNYYLVSVYDEDSNKDTLINRKDLRRFYHFDSTGTVKTQMVPPDYSVIRSQYDRGKDIMYLFARRDADKNGMSDKKEPVHIFWFDLKAPAKAKRLY